MKLFKKIIPIKDEFELPLAIKSANIPILILDKTWHDMFSAISKTPKLSELENKLSNLLKEQGRLTTNYKEYGSLKKNLMSTILGLTTEVFENNNDSAKDEMGRSQKYILDINEKFEQIETRLTQVEEELKKTSLDLLEESARICYKTIKDSRVQISVLDDQIERLREILKQKIDEKTTCQETFEKTYSYLHNLVGADIVNILDKEYGE